MEFIYITKIDKLLKLGLNKGRKAKIVKFPDWAFSSNSLLISMLRGIFDSDGCFYCHKSYGKYDTAFKKKYHCNPRIHITSISRDLMMDISKSLKILGFHPDNVRINKGNKNSGKNNQDSYSIRVSRISEIIRWFEIEKMSSNPKHITKYLVWRKYGILPPYTKIKDRRKILKGIMNPYYYAGVAERSIAVDISQEIAEPQELLP